MWTSKLGNKYAMAWMQENDKASQAELKRIRSLSGNGVCADCGRQDSSWASVTHGVFICMICSDVHRSVGTHITKVKGCTGTYLWGPDELEQMRQMGNTGADRKFGAKKISPDAGKELKQSYVIDKYDRLAFASKAHELSQPQSLSKKEIETTGKVAPTGFASAQPGKTASVGYDVSAKCPAPCTQDAPRSRAAEIKDSWFDDFFSDNTPAGKTAEHSLKQITSRSNDLGLDAFLDLTLQAKAEPLPAKLSAYPARLDPFQKQPVASELDPFADWPDF